MKPYIHFYSLLHNQYRILFQCVLATAPLFFATMGVTSGIVLYWYATDGIAPFLLAAVWAGIFAAFFKDRSPNKIFYIICLPVLCCMFGLFFAYKQDKEFWRKQLLFSSGRFSVRGVIHDIEKTGNPLFPYDITVRTTEYALSEKQWIACASCIKIMTKQYGSLSVDDYVEISDMSSNKVDRSFGYFLMKMDLSTYIFMPYLRSTRLSRPHFSIRRSFYRKRAALYQAIGQTCSEKTMIFFKMLFLGRKEHHNDESDIIDDYFKRWGIVHMTARSGMHMTLYVLLCTMLLQFFPLPFVFKQIMLIACSVLYALFSFPSVSFVRAFITSFCILLCHCITRRSDFLHVTLAVYIMQLLINPITLFFLDFQLSFLLTIGIGFFFKKYFYKLLI